MIIHVLAITNLVLGVIFTARFLEWRWPIDPNLPHAEVMSDWKVTCANLLLPLLLAPLTLPCTAAIVIWMGGGVICLPTDGLWYVVSLVSVLLVSDLYRYAVHRLSHAVPFLWSMHSFHHSANALTLITGARHLWLEKVFLGTFFPILAILFTIPVGMATIIGVIYLLPDGCAHLNVRFPMGRAITWINSPQWHRIHHSVQPEHQNKNFSGGLPLWDILFGTAWIPHCDEYPTTGLVPSEKVEIIDSIVWPLRHHLRRSRLTNCKLAATKLDSAAMR
jgi:sterol desaturase/sphingolipid hydroxylase (fatty acid hydroxylase superfamily)